jgi:hypothetical protein
MTNTHYGSQKRVMTVFVQDIVFSSKEFVHSEQFMGTDFGVIKIPFKAIPAQNVRLFRDTFKGTRYFMLTLDDAAYLCLNKEVLRNYVNNLRSMTRGH